MVRSQLKLSAMAEGHGAGDAMDISLVNEVAPTAQRATAFGTFVLHEMALSGFGAQNLARGGDLEPLRHGLLGFNTFWTTHKSFRFPSKERAI